MKKVTFFICGFAVSAFATQAIHGVGRLQSTEFLQNNQVDMANAPFLTTVDAVGSSVNALGTLQGLQSQGLECFTDFNDQNDNHGFFDDCCGCDFKNEWDCECGDLHKNVPESSQLSQHVVASTAQVIPAQVLTTTLDQVTEACAASDSEARRDVHIDTNFAVSGNLSTQRFDCLQECRKEFECFQESGAGHTDFAQFDSDHDCECDCHPISSHDRGDFDADCDCKEDRCCEHIEVDNPDKDIEERIVKSVERTISDVLSDVVNKIIASSIKNVIEIHH